ncbi:MAG: hypothetical protein ACRD2X_03785 [Vicinamibacteraceae bacterium]
MATQMFGAVEGEAQRRRRRRADGERTALGAISRAQLRHGVVEEVGDPLGNILCFVYSPEWNRAGGLWAASAPAAIGLPTRLTS